MVGSPKFLSFFSYRNAANEGPVVFGTKTTGFAPRARLRTATAHPRKARFRILSPRPQKSETVDTNGFGLLYFPIEKAL